MSSRLAILLLAFTVVAAAQQSAAVQPDYSNVTDILQGRRTLLSVNDLVIGGTVLKTSDGTKIEDKNISELPGFQRQAGDPEIMAHLFDSISGTLVYGHGSTLYAVDPISHATTSMSLGGNFSRGTFASADFLGDGFRELVSAFSYGSDTVIVNVVSPVDRNQFSKGVFAGRRTGFAFCNNSNPAVAIGDFDGDGRPEIALACVEHFALDLYIFQVNPDTLAVDKKAMKTLFFEPKLGASLITIAAGRFSTTLHDQLLVGLYTDGRFVNVSFDFENSLTPVRRDLVDGKVLPPLHDLSFQSGRFNPASPLSQVAAKLNFGPNNVQLGIIVLDDNLRIAHPLFAALPGVACSSSGFAVGGFARTEPIPQDPSKTQRSLNLQLAITTSNCAGSLGVNIYNVDPPKTAGADFVIDTNAILSRSLPQNADYGLPIIAGDIQARSVILGQPTKVVIQDSAQPSVVATMPPMHIDFIPKSLGEQPTLLNLSAVPAGFHTTYETNVTDAVQSSSKSTTSFSFGAEVSGEASVEIGSVENGLGIEVGASTRAAQDIEQTNEQQYGSYGSTSFDASTATGFSDKVWYTDSRFNVYVYPVIGQKVCPSGRAGCAETEKVPLTIQFSAPDKTERIQADGSLLPWYQPPWEPGNVFSYPATYKQLGQIIPNIDELSDSQTYSTDEGTSTARATWTKQTNEGASAGIDQNYSYEVGLSVSGAVGGAFVTGKASASLNLSGSSAFSNFNQSVTSVGKSAGIGIVKPGTFRSPTNYHYYFTPYIFGQRKPGSVVDEQPAPGDVSTFGMLRTAFTADPANVQAGSWWKQAYRTRPDVALNHPSRWTRVPAGTGNGLNCLESADGPNCFELAPRRPENLWDSNFHVMRGFFISNAASGGKGPQLTTATAGDELQLEARVYNYSFKAMPENSEVHVRLYAQQIDVNNLHRPVGSSVLIDEVKLPPIPAFSDDDDAPLNWVLAKTTFNTTGYDGKYLMFWVVAWIEDATGNMVPEVEGHGLTKKPEQITSLAEIGEETYSNNVGFYNAAFYVFPAQSSTASTGGDGEPATIDIINAQVSEKRVMQGQTVDVSAELVAENNNASGVTALLYDGDPHVDGTVFGLEQIPYIAENGPYQVEAPYNAGACGKHDLFVVVHEGTPNEVLWRVGKVKVDCAR
jgi:hypothetical protein